MMGSQARILLGVPTVRAGCFAGGTWCSSVHGHAGRCESETIHVSLAPRVDTKETPTKKQSKDVRRYAVY